MLLGDGETPPPTGGLREGFRVVSGRGESFPRGKPQAGLDTGSACAQGVSAEGLTARLSRCSRCRWGVPPACQPPSRPRAGAPVGPERAPPASSRVSTALRYTRRGPTPLLPGPLRPG